MPHPVTTPSDHTYWPHALITRTSHIYKPYISKNFEGKNKCKVEKCFLGYFGHFLSTNIFLHIYHVVKGGEI